MYQMKTMKIPSYLVLIYLIYRIGLQLLFSVLTDQPEAVSTNTLCLY